MNLYSLSTERSQQRHCVSANYGSINRVRDGWETLTFRSLDELAQTDYRFFMTGPHSVMSPITWDDGKRQEENYSSASSVFLDIEDGLLLKDALWAFRDFAGCVYTTKSHQLPKGDKAPSDRFRVVVGLDGVVGDLHTWQRIHDSLLDIVAGMDEATKDGARLYWLSRENGYIAPLKGSRVLSIIKLMNYASNNVLPVSSHRPSISHAIHLSTVPTQGIYDPRLETALKKWIPEAAPRMAQEEHLSACLLNFGLRLEPQPKS